jgi:hypothetical protein
MEILKGGNHSKDVAVYAKIILKWSLEKYGGIAWTGCM